jgi:hypothetical protein
MPRSYPPQDLAQVIGSGSRGNRFETAQLISNSPRRTCNIRRPGKSTCNAGTRAAASKPDNTAKRLRALRPRSHPGSLRSSSSGPGRAQLVQREHHQPPVGPFDSQGKQEEALLSRHVPRPDGYSTSPSRGKAGDPLGQARPRCRQGERAEGDDSRRSRMKPMSPQAHLLSVG